METLYDLLGALPKDDAEGLRTAFRQAVKGAHPDIHPGDPDAALKFREIVRANEILGDVEQRAAYDHLLDLARLEQELGSRRAVAARIHKFASGTIALAGASVVTVGGYLLFMHMSVASMAPANQVDVTVRASAEIAAPAGSSDTTGKSASLAKHESAGSPGPALTPSAAVPQPIVESVPAANVGPPLDRTAGARSLRARRVSADRKRDPNGGNIFHYLREFGRAFVDIEPAKRVEKPGRTNSSPAAAGKQRVDQARIASSVPSVSRQRTAAQDPSREERPAMVRMP
jgi:curved DNA-binding protein CbpA